MHDVTCIKPKKKLKGAVWVKGTTLVGVQSVDGRNPLHSVDVEKISRDLQVLPTGAGRISSIKRTAKLMKENNAESRKPNSFFQIPPFFKPFLFPIGSTQNPPGRQPFKLFCWGEQHQSSFFSQKIRCSFVFRPENFGFFNIFREKIQAKTTK